MPLRCVSQDVRAITLALVAKRQRRNQTELDPGLTNRPAPGFIGFGTLVSFRRSIGLAGLIALTVILVLGLQAARAPAAVLAGPLLAGLVFALGGLAWRPGPSLLLLSQAVIGCAIGSVMAPALADAALWSRGGAIMVAGLAPLLLGVLMSGFAARMTRMSSATAVWGLTPGGASAMIGLAAAAGADIQKVALFQYLRLLLAALTALAVAQALVGPTHASTPKDWTPALELSGVVIMAIAVGISAWSAQVLRRPSLAILLPIGFSGVLTVLQAPSLQTPPTLAAAAYAVVGWRIGLSFTRATVLENVRALPMMTSLVLALVAGCALIGLGLGWAFDIDPLTAHLATNPGGVDTVMIIAFGGEGDVPFVLAAHLLRFLAILLLARSVAQWIEARGAVRASARRAPKV